MFQSTRPRGARQAATEKADAEAQVSIHAPAWGATARGEAACPTTPRFNPRARVGRDYVAGIKDGRAYWFQSTRPRGARQRIRLSWSMLAAMFQSTRPRGARHQGRVHGLVHCPVSIHAPAWGATDRPAPRRRRRSSFNPRARVGRDGAAVLRMVPLSMFQSTRPRGARRSGRPSAACTRCFNPRARVGRDARQRQNPEHHQSFNPRARVGRDGRSSGLPKRLTCFNPRARVGRDV